MSFCPIRARPAVTVVAVYLALSGSASAQTAPAPAGAAAQEFSTRTDVVLVDVTVVDGQGQQVLGLGLSDFTLSVNGRTRLVQAMEYVSSAASRPAAVSASEPARPPVESGSGRYLLIVADEANLSFGAGRAVLRAAESLLDRLAPEDRVGVLRLPIGGGVEFTRDHPRAIEGLRGVTGRAQRARGSYSVYPSEALDLEERSLSEWPAAVIRECQSPQNGPCIAALETEARALLADLRNDTSTTLRILERVLRNLKVLGAPVNMVLISEGLFMDRAGESLSALASAAASARVTMHVVRPARDWYDASVRAPSSNRGQDDQLARQGLEQLAGQLRGGYHVVIGDGAAAFDRIGAELAGYYLLAFEPNAEDGTGRERRIRVEVKRRGVTVRSRSTFVLPTPSVVPTTASAVAATKPEPARTAEPEVSPPPMPVNAAAVRVGTYSMFNANDRRVRVLVAAEVGDPVTESSSWRVSLMLKDQAGTIVSNNAATVALTPTRASQPSPVLFSTEVALEPGDYSLNLAFVSGDGRVGMSEQKLAARFRPVPGGFSVSDLLVVGESEAGSAMRVAPVAVIDRDRATVFLEVQHDDAKALSDVRVTFEVAQAPDGPSIVATEPSSDTRANGTQRAFAASVPLGALPPGDYVMRTTVTGPGGARTQIARAFRFDRGLSRSAVGAPRGIRTGPPLMRAAAAVPSFALQQVLAPTVVRAFVDELEQRHPSSSALRSFLAGLAELQAKRLTQATAHFRQTLRAAPDFVGVAFYLGACYAAGGQDREAIGAWQMSLLSKGADSVYPAIVDAMLRVGESKKALELLEEAPNAWPDAPTRMRREAIARATMAEDELALPLFVTLLDAKAQDADLLFLGIQVMYRLYVSRGLNEADQTKFGNWARQYESLGGTESALVRAWRDHVGK